MSHAYFIPCFMQQCCQAYRQTSKMTNKDKGVVCKLVVPRMSNWAYGIPNNQVCLAMLSTDVGMQYHLYVWISTDLYGLALIYMD